MGQGSRALALTTCCVLALNFGHAGSSPPTEAWTRAMLAARERLVATNLSEAQKTREAERAWLEIKDSFPEQWDWTLQDGGPEFTQWFRSAGGSLERAMAQKAISELGPLGQDLKSALARAHAEGRSCFDIYARACEQRRELRLRTLTDKAPQFVFTKHHTIRPSFFAYTEGQSDAQHERHFRPDSELCLFEMKGAYGQGSSLVSDPRGAIRDPAVSPEGKRVLFAWKKSLNEDDYHLYELEIASKKVRQITFGLGFADYEPAWLPNGDIIFASTRCVQTVDCWWTEASNLYTCDPNGRFLRRVTFDQVHSIYPQVLDDGRVIYTRWDYNDRGQIFPQALFQMFADGTGQMEFYGNNSWFPTTIAHARGIPGTQKVMAILCGHHTSQAGKLAIIDPAKGRQENSGVQLIAPVRPTPAERVDAYGQHGELWAYPYPLSETECLVSYAPLGWDRPDYRAGDADFGIYWMHLDGRRELLAWDKTLPSHQPISLAPRKVSQPWPDRVDYRQSFGTYYLQDIYIGPGLEGVPRGTIKKLRVVALGFRPAGIGHNISGGPAGGALISTPIAIGNGSWDTKSVLGEATVHSDGSAAFTVPARTPVYFQALDERGYAIQTMRSWSTLQPNEIFACTGCHESKNSSPAAVSYGAALGWKGGPERLDLNRESARGFSFPQEVQPILDRHCVRCHNDRKPMLDVLAGRPFSLKDFTAVSSNRGEFAFSLLGTTNLDPTAGRYWSDAYLALTQASRDGREPNGVFQGNCTGDTVSWIGSQSVPEPLAPRFAGAVRSRLMSLLENGHKGVTLSAPELRTIACWIDLLVPYCGDYLEANAWSQADLAKYNRYLSKRQGIKEVERGNIQQFLETKRASNRSGADSETSR